MCLPDKCSIHRKDGRPGGSVSRPDLHPLAYAGQAKVQPAGLAPADRWLTGEVTQKDQEHDEHNGEDEELHRPLAAGPHTAALAAFVRLGRRRFAVLVRVKSQAASAATIGAPPEPGLQRVRPARPLAVTDLRATAFWTDHDQRQSVSWPT